jgi:hypothetical protein
MSTSVGRFFRREKLKPGTNDGSFALNPPLAPSLAPPAFGAPLPPPGTVILPPAAPVRVAPKDFPLPEEAVIFGIAREIYPAWKGREHLYPANANREPTVKVVKPVFVKAFKGKGERLSVDAQVWKALYDAGVATCSDIPEDTHRVDIALEWNFGKLTSNVPEDFTAFAPNSQAYYAHLVGPRALRCGLLMAFHLAEGKPEEQEHIRDIIEWMKSDDPQSDAELWEDLVDVCARNLEARHMWALNPAFVPEAVCDFNGTVLRVNEVVAVTPEGMMIVNGSSRTTDANLPVNFGNICSLTDAPNAQLTGRGGRRAPQTPEKK